jgi:hypothetical protein
MLNLLGEISARFEGLVDVLGDWIVFVFAAVMMMLAYSLGLTF